MSDIHGTTKIERAANNATFTLVARICMVFATVVGLPIALGMIERGINRSDKASDKLDDAILRVVQLQEQMKFGLAGVQNEVSNIRITVTDHEGRIRILERPTSRQ